MRVEIYYGYERCGYKDKIYIFHGISARYFINDNKRWKEWGREKSEEKKEKLENKGGKGKISLVIMFVAHHSCIMTNYWKIDQFALKISSAFCKINSFLIFIFKYSTLTYTNMHPKHTHTVNFYDDDDDVFSIQFQKAI